LQSELHRRVLIGMDGLRPSAELLDLLVELEIGGVMLFKRNVESVEQVAALTRELQSAAGGRLLIAIDHEGGRVQRLGPPFTQLPRGADVGRAGSVDLAFALGQLAARELSAVGVNLNFAPVVDVWTHPENTVIGDRAFGSEPEAVAALGAAFIRGHQAGGVAACAKHFPGHGATETDSHFALPRDLRSLDAFRAVDLIPFRRAASANVASIMTAHVECPEVDPLPATLSARWIREILRGELGFRGAVLSDDVEMKAIAEKQDPAEAAREAFRAGCDVVLVASGSASQHRAWLERLAAEPPEIPEAELSAGAARVEALKTEWVYGRPLADPRKAGTAVPAPDGGRLVAEVERAAKLA